MCKKVKPLDDFYALRNKNGKSYHQRYCKPCANKARVAWTKTKDGRKYLDGYNAKLRAFHATEEGKRSLHNRHMKTKYRMTAEKYDALHKTQHGLCAICQQPEQCPDKNGKIRRLAVDHCHKTGKVRALLCSHCNQGIGHFFDDPKLLESALRYLSKFDQAG